MANASTHFPAENSVNDLRRLCLIKMEIKKSRLQYSNKKNAENNRLLTSLKLVRTNGLVTRESLSDCDGLDAVFDGLVAGFDGCDGFGA